METGKRALIWTYILMSVMLAVLAIISVSLGYPGLAGGLTTFMVVYIVAIPVAYAIYKRLL